MVAGYSVGPKMRQNSRGELACREPPIIGKIERKDTLEHFAAGIANSTPQLFQ